MTVAPLPQPTLKNITALNKSVVENAIQLIKPCTLTLTEEPNMYKKSA